MRALLDVNVLIALLDANHLQHTLAMEWLGDHISQGWASCPLTQNGCLRILSQPAYPNHIPIGQVFERLERAVYTDHHEFWPGDVSLLANANIRKDRILSHRQLTDIYLLTLATTKGGTFVTLDKSVNRDAVIGSKKEHLLVIQ